MGAIRSSKEKALVRDFCARRAMHYSSLPTLARFGYGWFRRLFAAQQEALTLVAPKSRLKTPPTGPSGHR
jgi:lysozyme family protein